RLIGANDFSKIFRIELAGEFRGLDEIVEQDGELPSLAITRLTLDGNCIARRRSGVTTPDEDTSIFVLGDSLSVDELVLDGLEHVVAQVELHLEGTVGDAAPPAQGCNGLFEDLFERHGSRSQPPVRFYAIGSTPGTEAHGRGSVSCGVVTAPANARRFTNASLVTLRPHRCVVAERHRGPSPARWSLRKAQHRREMTQPPHGRLTGHRPAPDL